MIISYVAISDVYKRQGYEILFLIVQNQGMVITRERMIEFIEEKTGNYIEDNTVSVHMKRLREKLGQYQQQRCV